MEAITVRAKLIEILQTIQSLSVAECPVLTGGTKPIEALPGFDSKMWPVATGMLATALGIGIAADVNIFRLKGSKMAATIDEAVTSVCAIASPTRVVAAE